MTTSEAFPELPKVTAPAAMTRAPKGRSQRQPPSPAGQPATPQDDRLDLLLARMDKLSVQNGALLDELAQLRRENAELRR